MEQKGPWKLVRNYAVMQQVPGLNDGDAKTTLHSLLLAWESNSSYVLLLPITTCTYINLTLPYWSIKFSDVPRCLSIFFT